MVSINKQGTFKLLSYVTTKLAAAGFLLSVFFTFLLVASDFDMYEFVESISEWFLWAVCFGYAIFCSVVIDLVTYKFPRISHKVKIALYLIAGFSLFLVISLEVNIFTIIAGTVGAISALVYYFGTYLSDKIKPFRYIFAFILPIVFLVFIPFDFTEKEQWHEVKKENSYEATFEHFNGEHEVSIPLKAGQQVILSHQFQNTNGGGHGFRIKNEENKLVGITELGEYKWKFEVQETGVYRFVVTGDDVKGGFQLSWEIQ